MLVCRVNVSWLLYCFLLLFRIIAGPFLIGYVHPDEFFQGGQELFFGCPPTIPWEFESSNALRSVMPPALTTWLPLQIYNLLRMVTKTVFGRGEMTVGMGSLSGIEVLIVPRIACSLFSILAIDWSMWSICNAADRQNKNATMTKGGVPIPVLLLASAWPTMVMLTRPFSNSMECYFLALLMATVLTIEINEKHEFSSKSSVGLIFCSKVGTICALGVFTRFTFVFFAFPILLFLLNNMIRSFGIKSSIMWRKLGWMAISFVCVALGIVWADTVFYSARRNEESMHSSDHHDELIRSLFSHSSFVLTPFNALAYNSKISNLKDHGLHPRWTHGVVNMLIMYGPLALATYLMIATTLLNSAGSAPTNNPSMRKTIGKGGILMVSVAVVICGLGFLSIAPHQEPRFLLPLLLPLVLLGERALQWYPTVGLFVWILFNTILFTLFGILHQGGITQSLLAIGSTEIWTHQNQPTPWIYMHTYMPPTFLTRLSRDIVDKSRSCSSHQENGVCDTISFGVFGKEIDDACQKDEVRIVDLKGSGLDKLWDTLQSELPCTKIEESSESNYFLYVVVPAPLAAESDSDDGFGSMFSSRQGACQLANEKYECNHVQRYGPHLTTEDLPPFVGSVLELNNMLALSVYNISCATGT